VRISRMPYKRTIGRRVYVQTLQSQLVL
jgi:hypothetical protein